MNTAGQALEVRSRAPQLPSRPTGLGKPQRWNSQKDHRACVELRLKSERFMMISAAQDKLSMQSLAITILSVIAITVMGWMTSLAWTRAC